MIILEKGNAAVEIERIFLTQVLRLYRVIRLERAEMLQHICYLFFLFFFGIVNLRTE